MSETVLTRRRVLQVSGAAAMTTALAGCTGYGGEPDDDGGGGGDSGSDGDDGGSSDGDGGSDGGGDVDFDGWFDDVSNYDRVVDATDEDDVTVAVGTEGNGDYFAFDPPAIRIDTGTTVVWEWTGQGGAHDVSAEAGSFESELTSGEGETFEYTFDEAGTYKYACTPHKSMGMKGAVVVE